MIVGDPYNGRYKLSQKLGSGAFGEVFKGVNLLTKDQVAVKLEKVPSRHPQLEHESKVYARLSGGKGIPSIRYFGEEPRYNVLILDLLGPTLEDLFNKCKRRFSIKTTLMLASQMLARVEYIHSNDIIHRDIKPDNLLMGRSSGHQNTVFLVDFGQAKKYRNSVTDEHIPYREDKRPAKNGVVRYASISAQHGVEQSRRDDLESLGYVLIYFAKGSLPWQGLNVTTKAERYEKIKIKKMAIPMGALCEDLPIAFAMYFTYVRSLSFDQKPDYYFLQSLFRKCFVGLGYKHDFMYDWKML